MPDSDEQVQREVEEGTGTHPCIWQIHIVRKVLEVVLQQLTQPSASLAKSHERSDYADGHIAYVICQLAAARSRFLCQLS